MPALGASGRGLVPARGASILVSRIRLLLHSRVASVASPVLAASPGLVVLLVRMFLVISRGPVAIRSFWFLWLSWLLRLSV